MNTLGREKTRAEILRRLRSLRPDSVRRWGRMSPHEAVCHLADSFRMVTGQKSVSRATGPLQRTFVKWLALYLPLQWPAGVLTRPELDQLHAGTCPSEFTSDVAALEALVELVATRGNSLDWPEHPIFGGMSRFDWLRWAYLHMDHHLRQFGA